ncbi:MAG: 6-bladed beta-propeller, partial [Bacteroidales bacterium]|nr:6-bladed beta-propeller [Bacteroidales bacterium]
MTSILKHLIIIILFLSSCSEAKDSFPVINLESASSEIDLNINEILKDIRLVKLELVADDPIPPYGQRWVGKKHILLFSRAKVYQYTRDGSFVRILMNRGQGPGEYNYVHAYDVNEDKNLLYWTDYGRKGKILVT